VLQLLVDTGTVTSLIDCYVLVFENANYLDTIRAELPLLECSQLDLNLPQCPYIHSR